MATGTMERTTGGVADALAAEVRRAIDLSREGSRAEAESVMEAACAIVASAITLAGSGA